MIGEARGEGVVGKKKNVRVAKKEGGGTIL